MSCKLSLFFCVLSQTITKVRKPGFVVFGTTRGLDLGFMILSQPPPKRWFFIYIKSINIKVCVLRGIFNEAKKPTKTRGFFFCLRTAWFCFEVSERVRRVVLRLKVEPGGVGGFFPFK